jgi:hypothetical protein
VPSKNLIFKNLFPNYKLDNQTKRFDDESVVSFVYTLYSYTLYSTPSQIQHGGFIRTRMGKSGDMIRDQVRILYLLFLWFLYNNYSETRNLIGTIPACRIRQPWGRLFKGGLALTLG